MDSLQTIPPVTPLVIPTLPATLVDNYWGVDTYWAVDNYWADFLGCDLDQLLSDGNIHRLVGTKHEHIWAMARHSSWVVSVPDDWPKTLCEQMVGCFQPNQVPDAGQLQQLLAKVGNQQLYGPALILLYDRSRYQQPSRGESVLPLVRPLTAADHGQISAFQAAAAPIVWSMHEPLYWPKIFGVFVDEQLVATCGVRIWGELLAELYIDTVPTQRRRGYGKIATDAALHWVHTETPYLAESVVELANAASWQLMHNAGFMPYAYMVTSFVTD